MQMLLKNVRRLVLVSLMLLGAFPTRNATAQSPDEITFALGWLPSGVYAMYFVALDKGYYKDANLSVKIVRGFGSGDTVKRIAASQADVGSADFGALMAAKGQGKIPVKVIAIVEGESPSGILYRTETGIKVPADLKGKTIARSASGAGSAILQAFFDANKMPMDSVNFVVTDASGYLPLLLSKKVDAIAEQAVVLPKYSIPAAKEGITLKAMTFSEAGLSFYGATIITNDDTIAKRSDALRRFLSATFKGYQTTFANPREAAEILLKYHPESGSMESLLGELEIEQGLIMTDDVKKHGLGFINAEKLERSRALLTKALNLPTETKADELYSSDLLPK